MRVALASAMLSAIVAGGCGEVSSTVVRPFIATGHVEGGLSSRLWGDGASTPTGMHLGCVPGRHFALVVTLRNRSATSVTLTAAPEDHAPIPIIRRVAVQFRLAPPPPKGDLLVVGLRRWSTSVPNPVTIPSGREAWVQSNFAMSNCELLSPHQELTTNRVITVTYRANGHAGSEQVALLSARIILTAATRLQALRFPASKR